MTRPDHLASAVAWINDRIGQGGFYFTGPPKDGGDLAEALLTHARALGWTPPAAPPGNGCEECGEPRDLAGSTARLCALCAEAADDAVAAVAALPAETVAAFFTDDPPAAPPVSASEREEWRATLGEWREEIARDMRVERFIREYDIRSLAEMCVSLETSRPSRLVPQLRHELASACRQISTLTTERDAARARIEADAELVAEASRTWAVLTNRNWMETRQPDSAIEAARQCMDSQKKALLERDSAEAERDALAAQVAALREAAVVVRNILRAFRDPVLRREYRLDQEAETAIASIDARLSAPDQAAADHDAGVRAKALEEAARDCEARAADEAAAPWGQGQWRVMPLREQAARIRALAAQDPKEVT